MLDPPLIARGPAWPVDRRSLNRRRHPLRRLRASGSGEHGFGDPGARMGMGAFGGAGRRESIER
jgi:hypothetical protein